MVSSGMVKSKPWFIPFLTGVLIALLLLLASVYVFVNRLNGVAYIERYLRPDARFVTQEQLIDALTQIKRLNDDNLLINARYDQLQKRFDQLSTDFNTSRPLVIKTPAKAVAEDNSPIKQAHMSKLERLQRDCSVHILQYNIKQSSADLAFIKENCS